MRVLHLIGVMGVGGAEALVSEMVRRGEAVGWVSGIASAGGVQQDELGHLNELMTYDVPASRRTASGVRRATSDTVRAIRDFQPEVILAHNVGVSFVGDLARRWIGHGQRRIPLITVFHGVAAKDYRVSAAVLTLCSDTVITVSEAILTRLREQGLRGRALVIPNAVTMPPAATREEARRALGLGEEPVALCLARMVQQKRHDVLLDAWAEVPEPAVLLLAGHGELRPTLEERARLLGIADRVRFLGVRRDVPDLLSACDVTVLSSDWEGLPISVLESMAAGRPPIVTAVDGNAEAIGPGAGLLVPRRNPRALAEALRVLLFDTALRETAGAAARQRVAERHNPERLMLTYDALLRATLDGCDAST